MSSENEEVRRLLLAKQNPETGAALLRKLTRSQLQLWQEIGRKGRAFAMRWHASEVGATRLDRLYNELLSEDPGA